LTRSIVVPRIVSLALITAGACGLWGGAIAMLVLGVLLFLLSLLPVVMQASRRGGEE
jgi:hypothetical protein